MGEIARACGEAQLTTGMRDRKRIIWGMLRVSPATRRYTELSLQQLAVFEAQTVIEIPITTERLTIRRFEAKNLEPLLRFMLDDDSTRFLTFDAEQKTEPGATALFEYVLQAYASPEPVYSYAVVERETDEYVGSCGYAPYEDGIVECYYAVNAEHRGKGIATEAAKALIQALASTPEVREIRAYCHAENSAAHDVALQSGMTAKGLAMHKDSSLESQLFARITG